MRRLDLVLAAPVLLGPAALAFAKGGYFDLPRLLARRRGMRARRPRRGHATRGRSAQRAARASADSRADGVDRASIAWAPIAGAAADDFQRLLLYLVLVLRRRGAPAPAGRPRLVEPVLLAGIVAAALYGLSERLLPGVFSLQALPSADDRLAWPLTYWNAMGALRAWARLRAAWSRDAVGPPPAPPRRSDARPLGARPGRSRSRAARSARRPRPRRPRRRCAHAPRARRVALVACRRPLPPGRPRSSSPPSRRPRGGARRQGAAMLVVLVRPDRRGRGVARPRAPRSAASTARCPCCAGGRWRARGRARRDRARRHAGREARRAGAGANPSRLVSSAVQPLRVLAGRARRVRRAPAEGGGSGVVPAEWLRERTIDEPSETRTRSTSRRRRSWGSSGWWRCACSWRDRRDGAAQRRRRPGRSGRSRSRDARGAGLGLGDAGADAGRAGARRAARHSGRSTSTPAELASTTEPAEREQRSTARTGAGYAPTRSPQREAAPGRAGGRGRARRRSRRAGERLAGSARAARHRRRRARTARPPRRRGGE